MSRTSAPLPLPVTHQKWLNSVPDADEDQMRAIRDRMARERRAREALQDDPNHPEAA